MNKIVTRLKREPLALRAIVAIAANLLVVAGVLHPGQSHEADAIIVGGLNLLLLKGARDRVTPTAAVPPAAE